MKKVTNRICPICEWTNAEILHTQKFVLPEGHPLAEGYDVVCCDRCGFVFANTTVKQEDYDVFYAKYSKYEDNKTSTGGGETSWDNNRLSDTARYISGFLLDRNTRILDIGCANGGMLKQLQKLGFNNLCGIDPSPACVTNTQLLGIEAYTASLFDVPKDIGQFDFIILSHVLEHVQDLRMAVQYLSTLSKLEGCIYIEVPDATLYADYIFSPFQDFNTEHINHFSNQSMSNLMQLAGFQLKESGQKLIESSPNMPYPVIYSLWNNTQKAIPHSDEFERDNLLEKNIKTYISRSKTIMNGIEVKIQSLLAKSPEVIIWGTGQLAMKLLAETSLAKANIVAFVDGNPINHGKVINGIPISSPKQIIGMIQPIIVTSILHQKAISDFIRNEMKLSNEIICLYPYC